MFGGIGFEARQIDDREFRCETLELLRRRADQKLMHEERVPRIFGDDAHRQAMLKIGPTIEVFRVQLLAFREFHHVGVERVELRRGHGAIFVPPHLALCRGVAHDEFVCRGAAGVLTGQHDEGAVFGDMAFVLADRMFIEFRNGEIPVHGLQIAKTLFLQAESLSVSHCIPRGIGSPCAGCSLVNFAGQSSLGPPRLQRNSGNWFHRASIVPSL